MPRARWTPTPRREPVTVPAAGVDWSRRNDSGGLWLIRGILARLVTSAVVANREPSIIATAGEDVWFRSPVQVAQPASSTVDYCAFPGAVAGVAASTGRLFGWPTEGLLLPPGHVLAATTVLVDIGDQWSAIFLDLIEYPEVLPEHLVPTPYTSTESDQE